MNIFWSGHLIQIQAAFVGLALMNRCTFRLSESHSFAWKRVNEFINFSAIFFYSFRCKTNPLILILKTHLYSRRLRIASIFLTPTKSTELIRIIARMTPNTKEPALLLPPVELTTSLELLTSLFSISSFLDLRVSRSFAWSESLLLSNGWFRSDHFVSSDPVGTLFKFLAGSFEGGCVATSSSGWFVVESVAAAFR